MVDLIFPPDIDLFSRVHNRKMQLLRLRLSDIQRNIALVEYNGLLHNRGSNLYWRVRDHILWNKCDWRVLLTVSNWVRHGDLWSEHIVRLLSVRVVCRSVDQCLVRFEYVHWKPDYGNVSIDYSNDQCFLWQNVLYGNIRDACNDTWFFNCVKKSFSFRLYYRF